MRRIYEENLGLLFLVDWFYDYNESGVLNMISTPVGSYVVFTRQGEQN